MYKSSLFSKILKLIDTKGFNKAVQAKQSDKHNKGFDTWSHFAVMLYAQFVNCRSLRDLEIQWNSHNHYHLGIGPLRRSTLSDANRKRTGEVFSEIAGALMDELKIRPCDELSQVVRLLDSSTIHIKGRGRQWAQAGKTRCGQGLKIHVQCGGEDRVIEKLSITATNVNDVTAAQQLSLEPQTIYVFDKGYLDFNWWHKISEEGSYFVTRIKTNTAYKVLRENEVSSDAREKGIEHDHVIELTNRKPRGGKENLLAGQPLRLIQVHNREQNKVYRFISNLHDHSAEQIADYYRRRWGIELLFKWLKQNLKIKTFLAENENAIKIQIYIAIIAYLLLLKLKRLSQGRFKRTLDLLYWVKTMIWSAAEIVFKALAPPCEAAPVRGGE